MPAFAGMTGSDCMVQDRQGLGGGPDAAGKGGVGSPARRRTGRTDQDSFRQVMKYTPDSTT